MGFWHFAPYRTLASMAAGQIAAEGAFWEWNWVVTDVSWSIPLLQLEMFNHFDDVTGSFKLAFFMLIVGNTLMLPVGLHSI